MKKSLIALAVAGLVSAPAFAATSNVDIYGVMNIAIQDTDASGVDLDVVDNVSRIGFKGSEDLGGGLKAVWQIEQQLDVAGNTTGVVTAATGTALGGAGLRNSFIGLAGGFGTALVGRHDTPYKIATGKYDIFADTISDYNGRAINGVTVDLVNSTHDARVANAIAYISPNFSGLTVAAAVVTSMDNINSSDTIDATSIAAMYGNGPLTVDAAYQNVEAVAGGSKGLKLGVGYTFGDAKVGFVYEDINNSTAADRDSWLVNVAYGMGPITLKAQYGQVDLGATDPDKWDLGVDYSMSKRTTAYFVYSNVDNDAGTDGKGWNVGVKHSF